MVVVDSNIWINYLRSPGSPTGTALQSLLNENRVLMTGPVLEEVLQGAQGEAEFAVLQPRLESIPYVEPSQRTWAAAGSLSMKLRGSGQITPLTDLLIAAVALEGDHELFTLDSHFRRVPNLMLYTVNTT